MKYNYIVDIDHYTNGNGYSHTETLENDFSSEIMTAEDWYKGYISQNDDLFDDEKESITIKVRVYREGSDPMFDDPISESEYTPD